MKKTLSIVIILLELLILSYTCFFYGRAREFIVFDDDKLYLTSGGEKVEDGYYFDASYEQESLAIRTPSVKLNKGIYDVVVHCNTNSRKADLYTVDLRTQAFQDMNDIEQYVPTPISESNELSYMSDSVTYKINVTENNADVYILNSREDNRSESYLLIDEISINYNRKISVIHSIIIRLFIFLLLDIALYLLLFKKVEAASFIEEHVGEIILFSMAVFIAQMPMLDNTTLCGHDIDYHLRRLIYLAEELKTGQFPVRIESAWLGGYGYANSIGYSDLLLMPFSILYMVGFKIEFVYKLYVLASNMGIWIISYFCFKRMLGKVPAMMGATFYLLSAYRLEDLYVRAAVGEYSAMTFIPLLLLGIYLIYDEQRYPGGEVALILSASLILHSHPISCFMVLVFCILFGLYRYRRTFTKETLLSLGKAMMMILLVNAWYLLPFIDYMMSGMINKTVSKIDYMAGTSFSEIFISTFLMMNEGEILNMDSSEFNTLGITTFFLVASTCYLIIRYKDKISEKTKKGAIMLLLLDLIAFYLSSDLVPLGWISIYMKPIIGVLQNMQFMWRFLSMATAISAVLFAVVTKIVLDVMEENTRKCYFMISLVIIMVQAVVFTGTYVKTHNQGLVQEGTGVHGGEWLIQGTNKFKLIKDFEIKAEEGISSAQIVRKNGTHVYVDVEAGESGGMVTLPIVAYKGYKAWVSGTKDMLNIDFGAQHRLRIEIPANFSGVIEVKFVEPFYWRISELISLLSLGFLIYMVFSRRLLRKMVNGDV